MEIEPLRIEVGEEKAWRAVDALDRIETCARSLAEFDEHIGAYLLNSFGMRFSVYLSSRKILSASDEGCLFTAKLRNLFGLAALHYLLNAKDIPRSGRLVRPIDLKGGHIFSAGTHVLPLDVIAEKFSEDPDGFLEQGRQFGGEQIEGQGDAALRLYPFPRVPVTMILWVREEGFPPRVDLFFDSTCEFQLQSVDIVWAVGMICSLVMGEAG